MKNITIIAIKYQAKCDVIATHKLSTENVTQAVIIHNPKTPTFRGEGKGVERGHMPTLNPQKISLPPVEFSWIS